MSRRLLTGKPVLWKIIMPLFVAAMIFASCGDDSETTNEPTDTTPDTTSDTTLDSAADDMSDDMAAKPDDMSDDMAAKPDDMGSMTSLLTTVQTRGTLVCGVSGAAVAFSETAPDGSQTGFDVDFCKVVAAAILGDASKVRYVPLESAERFTALQTGEVDLLMRNTTWTQSRDTDLGLDFGPTTYFDGQQLMARVGDGFTADSQVVDIDGSEICTNAGTTTEKNIKDAADGAGIEITLKTYTDFDKVTDDFISRACDVVTTDGSALVGRKAKQQPEGQEWVIFPASPISKEPLGPVYNQNDSLFADAVNWAVYATIIADEKGINQGNVDEICTTIKAIKEAQMMADEEGADPVNESEMIDDLLDAELGRLIDAEVGRLLGGTGELQTAMGLSPDAFCNVISQVGNYDEIFTRNLGPVGLIRAGSPNAPYTEGGLIYAPPAR